MVIARLQTAGVICLETFKEFPQMARFTLRDEGECDNCTNGHFHGGVLLYMCVMLCLCNTGKTIAIGKVLKLIE